MKAVFDARLLVNSSLIFNLSVKELGQKKTFTDFLLVSGGLEMVVMKFV